MSNQPAFLRNTRDVCGSLFINATSFLLCFDLIVRESTNCEIRESLRARDGEKKNCALFPRDLRS